MVSINRFFHNVVHSFGWTQHSINFSDSGDSATVVGSGWCQLCQPNLYSVLSHLWKKKNRNFINLDIIFKLSDSDTNLNKIFSINHIFGTIFSVAIYKNSKNWIFGNL